MIKFNSNRQLKPFVKQMGILNAFQYLSYLQSPEIQIYWKYLDIMMINKLFNHGVYDEHSKKVAISYLPNILRYIYNAKYKNFKIKISPSDDDRKFVKLYIKFNVNNYTVFIFRNDHIVTVEHSSDEMKTNFNICASNKITNKWKIERCFPLCLGV